jgi:HlyD family secretion protein
MAKKSKRLRNILIGAGILLVLLVIAKKAGWIGEDDSIKVSIEKAAKHNITETVTSSGKVQPEVEVKISADVSGEIVDLFVKEGDVVKRGTLLAKINPEIYISSLDRMVASVNSAKASLENTRSRLTQTQSQFAQAQSDFSRNKKLYDEKIISDAEWEAARTSFEVAKAEADASLQALRGAEFQVQSSEASLKEARENLNKTSIYAPVDGTVSKLSKEKGERVVGTQMMEGTEILRLANLNEMEVNVEVSENDIVRVKMGDTALIDIDAFMDKKFKGIVTEIANSANVAGTNITEQVTNFPVKIRILRESYSDLIDSLKPQLSPFRPGMSASVDIQTKSLMNVLSVPIQSVTTRDTSAEGKKRRTAKGGGEKPSSSESISKKAEEKVTECVFIVNDGTVKLQAVKTGIQDNNFIHILSGINEGDEVVVSPFNALSRKLKDGDKVKVVPKEELFDAAAADKKE